MKLTNKIMVLLALLAWALLAGPGWCQENYLLGPEDEIEIRVWDHDDLTRKMRIGLDGRIAFPFVGDVPAAGRTIFQLQKDLQDRLGSGYIVNPHVSVTVMEHRSQKFSVVGNVGKPGTYPLTKPITLVEALSQAGGLVGDASSKGATPPLAYVVRASGGKSQGQTITVSLPAALAGDPRQNIVIQNGDTINVPMLYFFVTGEVKTAGRFAYDKDLTVLQAVTTAGGFSDKAARKRTYIIRAGSGGKHQVKVRLEDLVQPGDTIVVPESWF
jgi:polysaccharide biosynthesis/export protein